MNRDVPQRVFWRLSLVVLLSTATVAGVLSAATRGPVADASAPLAGKAGDAALDGLRRTLAALSLEVVVEDGRPAIAWNDFALERHELLDYLRKHTFTFIAKKSGEKAPDVYRARARVSAAGVPIEVSDLVNLTRTEHGHEQNLAVLGPFVAFSNRIDGKLNQVMLLDYRGERDSPGSEQRGLFDRFMDAVANWQEVNDARGVERRTFELSRPPASAKLELVAGPDGAAKLVVGAEGRALAVIDAASGAIEKDTPSEGLTLAAVAPMPRPKRMVIDWVANTIRRVVGSERFEWLKIYALGVKDKWRRLSSVFLGPEAPQADEVEAVPVVAAHAPVKKLNIDFGQDANWPPPPVEPLLKAPKLKGEGQWVDIYDFDLRNTGAPPALLKTVLRPDPKRPHAAVRIVLIDPRQVDLHVVAGTKHPESTTGLHGDGMIPRDKETMGRLLAAFNGGFKTMHGAYGMMVKGKVIVPPKNGAATVARMADGRIAMGTWDAPDGAKLPGAVAIRQNLPPLVEQSVINPTGVKKWGNTVQDLDSDGKHTYRSAVGLTANGHLMYVWGDDLSHETMALAMTRAGCVYAVHLDMNFGHSRLEFYRVFDDASIARARPDRKIYNEGGLRFQAKKLSTSQISWLYPRYVKRDIRDFFYVTLRRVFPYDDGTGLGFGVDGLPEELREWPPPLVRATTRVGAADVQVYKLDHLRMRAKLRLGASEGAAGPAAREIDRADVPRLAAILGLGLAPGAAPAGPAGRLALVVDKKGVVRIEAPDQAGKGGALVRPALALVDGGKVLEDASLAVAGGEPVWRGALGVDARGDLLYALAQTSDASVLAKALVEGGALRGVALPGGGRGAFLRVFTPGEREGEIVATSLVDGKKEPLRSMPLTNEQTFLYVLPEAPPARVVALESVLPRAKTAAAPAATGSDDGAATDRDGDGDGDGEKPATRTPAKSAGASPTAHRK